MLGPGKDRSCRQDYTFYHSLLSQYSTSTPLLITSTHHHTSITIHFLFRYTHSHTKKKRKEYCKLYIHKKERRKLKRKTHHLSEFLSPYNLISSLVIPFSLPSFLGYILYIIPLSFFSSSLDLSPRMR